MSVNSHQVQLRLVKHTFRHILNYYHNRLLMSTQVIVINLRNDSLKSRSCRSCKINYNRFSSSNFSSKFTKIPALLLIIIMIMTIARKSFSDHNVDMANSFHKTDVWAAVMFKIISLTIRMC